MKTIKDFEVLHHGCMYSDYFQGCGVSYTAFDDVATGIGSDLTEAIDDCIEPACRTLGNQRDGNPHCRKVWENSRCRATR